MNDLLTVLYYLNQHQVLTQRELAKATALSLGKINLMIKRLVENGYLTAQKEDSKTTYHVTDKGLQLLEQDMHDKARRKISLQQANQHIKLAVILAAGRPREIDHPIPLLPLGETRILDRTLNVLRRQGIERVVIVAGFQAQALRDYTKDWPYVTIVENPDYDETGTMASLAATADVVNEDFLLLEGDLVFESRGISQLMMTPVASAMLITAVRKRHDEAMVEVRDGYIYKMSKDIHQFNRIDGEMIGLSKFSYAFFQKMLAIYAENTNAWVNYEYVMMDVSRDYHLGYVKLDDFVWGEIDELSQQHRVLNTIYPRLVKKEKEETLLQVKAFLHDQMNATDEMIDLLESAGGMTNYNYHVILSGVPYIVRIAGKGTEKFINRKAEKANSGVAQVLNLDSETVYFDEMTGIKVSGLIEDAETLNQTTATYRNNMRLTTDLLRRLHQSGLDFENRFDVFKEIQKYESFVDEVQADYYEGYPALREAVFSLQQDLAALPAEIVPCHIDTVPENFVKGKKQAYLIDWEYSGMNDYAWDLGAHSLECQFTPQQEREFLRLYCEAEQVPAVLQQKILIYQICQDFLWSIWTVFKESRGDDFGDYGIKRFKRAQVNMQRYQERYRKG